MSESILEVRGLRCSIAGQQVVEDVTFSVPATGITAVLGRNGVGKTSTLRGILGLIHRRGEVRLGDSGEFGSAFIEVQDGCVLFDGLWAEGESHQVWMSHGDKVTELAPGFRPVAVSPGSPYAVVASGHLFARQEIRRHPA